MRTYADLHIHSKYSRACSPALTSENIDLWCRIKGLGVVATGDFTHPKWFQELLEKLEPIGNGLYKLKPNLRIKEPKFTEKSPAPVYFIIGTELSCIYSHAGATRRVHHCVFMSSLEKAAQFNQLLVAQGCNLRADGRPILGLSSQRLLQLLLQIDDKAMLIPAHAWTPWFAVFGSKSGYDTLDECFEDLTEHIFAIETGLSSDPPMNWQVSALDKVALVSNSDAHSLPNLGREATIFAGSDISYEAIRLALKNGNPVNRQQNLDKNLSLRLSGTVEFFPDEGRYHYDGHRDCRVCFSPNDTTKHKGICPVCKRELTIGVLNRVNNLADRSFNYKPAGALSYISLIELDKVIAQALGIKGRQSKAVDNEYWSLVSKGGNEFNVLANLSQKELEDITSPLIAEAIRRLRQGEVFIEPGYDGEYGIINLFKADEIKPREQDSLF